MDPGLTLLGIEMSASGIFLCDESIYLFVFEHPHQVFTSLF